MDKRHALEARGSTECDTGAMAYLFLADSLLLCPVPFMVVDAVTRAGEDVEVVYHGGFGTEGPTTRSTHETEWVDARTGAVESISRVEP